MVFVNRLTVFLLPLLHLLQVDLRVVHLPLLCRVSGQWQQCISWTFGGATSNDAMVEMAIADFFHCENIPDAVVESPRFKRLISVCRLLGDKFVPPNDNKI